MVVLQRALDWKDSIELAAPACKVLSEKECTCNCCIREQRHGHRNFIAWSANGCRKKKRVCLCINLSWQSLAITMTPQDSMLVGGKRLTQTHQWNLSIIVFLSSLFFSLLFFPFFSFLFSFFRAFFWVVYRSQFFWDLHSNMLHRVSLSCHGGMCEAA